MPALCALRVACRNFSIRVARYLLPGAGLALTFWAFSALAQAHADVLPPRPQHVAQSSYAPAKALRRGPLAAANHRATKTAASAARRTLARLGGERPGRRRIRAARVRAGSADATRDPYATAPEADGHPACHPPRTELPPPHPQARARAEHRSRTTPVAHRAPRLHPRRGVPMTAVRRMKPTGRVEHAPKHKAERTEPTTPVSAPVSGSGEGDCGRGKTPTGTGDVPRLTLRPPGLWSIVRRPTVRVGRYIAGEPSFSPD